MSKLTRYLTSDYLKSWPLYLLPHHLISRVIFWATRQPIWLKNPLGRMFIRLFDVDMSEAEKPRIEDYPTFNAFFTRALKTECRPIATTEYGLISPVDGTVSQAGSIISDQLFQAKGHSYSLLELVGGEPDLAAKFSGGRFATLYLSPRDYHRIHMPIAGTLVQMTYIPGRLFSVAEHTVRTVPRLFARNERVVCVFTTVAGPVALILVGAINVAAIETAWSGLVTPGRSRHIRHFAYAEKTIHLAQAAEMGRFNMGSTVIVLATEQVQWQSTLKAGEKIKFGENMGRFLPDSIEKC